MISPFWIRLHHAFAEEREDAPHFGLGVLDEGLDKNIGS
jgi:hypothetical protein